MSTGLGNAELTEPWRSRHKLSSFLVKGISKKIDFVVNQSPPLVHNARGRVRPDHEPTTQPNSRGSLEITCHCESVWSFLERKPAAPVPISARIACRPIRGTRGVSKEDQCIATCQRSLERIARRWVGFKALAEAATYSPRAGVTHAGEESHERYHSRCRRADEPPR
jgi:hypothetical protein